MLSQPTYINYPDELEAYAAANMLTWWPKRIIAAILYPTRMKMNSKMKCNCIQIHELACVVIGSSAQIKTPKYHFT
jgi:hypothetical protein